MRMWNVNPKIMCRQHLLGEHVEMHMFIGTIKKGISLKGYIDNKLVVPKRIVERHDALVEEMISRDYNHRSPLDYDCSNLPYGFVDEEANFKNLVNRCRACRWRSILYIYFKSNHKFKRNEKKNHARG